jgi:hypothetical protein
VRHSLIVLQLTAVTLAVTAAVVPLPAGPVERWYASWAYPALQAHLTTWSNASPLALVDALLVFSAVGVLVLWSRWLVGAVRGRSVRPLLRGAATTITLAAIGYLWFLGAWGLNYARAPLEPAVGFDAGLVTRTAVHLLAERSLAAVNATHAAAHAAGFPGAHDRPPDLVQALHAVERQLGRPSPTVPSRPKRTLLAPFFRAAGVDGLHAPFLLETLLNPDLTPPERPAVLAHEWAHLSGFAPEDDASFVGVMAALEADAASQYSGWLALFHETIGQLPAEEQRLLVSRLDPGPRADRLAIARRLQARDERVARASWETYDRYLKAQGVDEGVASYSRVVQLVIGSRALDAPPWRKQ